MPEQGLQHLFTVLDNPLCNLMCSDTLNALFPHSTRPGSCHPASTQRSAAIDPLFAALLHTFIYLKVMSSHVGLLLFLMYLSLPVHHTSTMFFYFVAHVRWRVSLRDDAVADMAAT